MDASNIGTIKPNITSTQQSQSDPIFGQLEENVSGAHTQAYRPKEIEPHVQLAEQTGLSEVGKDIELPKEVKEVGVRLSQSQQTVPKVISYPLPEKNIPTQLVQPLEEEITLPISDAVISSGLSQGVFSSWRWLSEWCSRKLKQAHRALKTVHGQIVRVKV